MAAPCSPPHTGAPPHTGESDQRARARTPPQTSSAAFDARRARVAAACIAQKNARDISKRSQQSFRRAAAHFRHGGSHRWAPAPRHTRNTPQRSTGNSHHKMHARTGSNRAGAKARTQRASPRPPTRPGQQHERPTQKQPRHSTTTLAPYSAEHTTTSPERPLCSAVAAASSALRHAMRRACPHTGHRRRHHHHKLCR